MLSTTNAARLLLVDLSEGERHGLWERLHLAGFDVMIAINHADLCLRLLTWRPHGIIVDGDLSGMDPSSLVNLIQTSAPVPVAIVFLCGAVPTTDLDATLLLKPVAFPDLLAAVRGTLADRDMSGRHLDGWSDP